MIATGPPLRARVGDRAVLLDPARLRHRRGHLLSGRTADGSATGSDGSATQAMDETATGAASADATAGGTTDAGDGPTGGSADAAGTTGAGACMGMALDAQLEVPPACAPTCMNIGSGNDCAGIEICRLKDSATAVCESCEPCGNLDAACTASNQCDILFTCFMGRCTAMCDLNTPQTCGNPAACTNVGHPTHGVCDPNL